MFKGPQSLRRDLSFNSSTQTKLVAPSHKQDGSEEALRIGTSGTLCSIRPSPDTILRSSPLPRSLISQQQLHNSNKHRREKLRNQKMVYTIVVHLYAKDSADSISKLHNKLLEASAVYSKDRETVSWFVMQDHQDKRAFTIVERFEHESVCLLFPFPFSDTRGQLRSKEWV